MGYKVGPTKDNVLVDVVSGEPIIFKTLYEAVLARDEIIGAYPETKIWQVGKIIKKKHKKL